jgi:oligopeptide transport system ATP-binding protein
MNSKLYPNKHPLLQVKNLKVSFPNLGKRLYAVRDISFEVFEGESLGIVGESGSGKTTTMHAITGLTKFATIEGSAFFEDLDLINKSHKVLGSKIGMMFQDPMTSLNPTMKVVDQITEGMIYHKIKDRKEAYLRALELLTLVGISNAKERASQYPHQFSGGQRQRIAIAIALACNPKMLIADEPTTALDATIKIQIIRLIQEIQKTLNMSLILISHDLGMIGQICDRIIVFYAGKIVEEGKTFDIFQHPKHPYTQMLLDARPSLNYPKSKPLRVIEGSSPLLTQEIKGCSFVDRCPYKVKNCSEDPPLLKGVACWRSHD